MILSAMCGGMSVARKPVMPMRSSSTICSGLNPSDGKRRSNLNPRNTLRENLCHGPTVSGESAVVLLPHDSPSAFIPIDIGQDEHELLEPSLTAAPHAELICRANGRRADVCIRNNADILILCFLFDLVTENLTEQ